MPELTAWNTLPFHFWSVVFAVLGSVVGSFLNVCIHRLPRGESIIHPPSHCPHCQARIPWQHNIPLVSWLRLRGRCVRCQSPISPRYFVVELATALAFVAVWIAYGGASPGLALAYGLMLAGFIAATLIDFEHFIIPDQITLGGCVAGFLCAFAVPALHHAPKPAVALQRSALGMLVGAGLVYAILRVAKIFLGRQRFAFAPGTRVVFGESGVTLPDQEIPYEDIFYRKSDTITLHAQWAQLWRRRFQWRFTRMKHGVRTRVRSTTRLEANRRDVPVSLSPARLQIGDQVVPPETVSQLAVVTDALVIPREAMGLGDVKFMAAIGAFLGWPGVLFSLMVSSILGAAVGVGLILLRQRAWSSRLPYGPYLAAAATFWIFGGERLVDWWLRP